MSLRNKLKLIGDAEDVLAAASSLADAFPAVRPAFDKLVGDLESAVCSLSFDAATQVLSDTKEAWNTLLSQYGPNESRVIAFKDAVSKLLADAKS